MKNSLEWCSASITVLVAALGGSGAVSSPMVDRLDGYLVRHANWVRYNVGLSEIFDMRGPEEVVRHVPHISQAQTSRASWQSAH